MKKIVAAFLSLLILLFCGCAESKDSTGAPADFYYISSAEASRSKEDVFRIETRETKHLSNITEILNLYLKGPENQEFKNVFPEGTQVISIERNDKAVFIVLTDQFSTLSGLNLTLAGACLCYTVYGLTDAHVLNISCQSAPLNGRSSITFVWENLLTFDDATVPVATTESEE